jgi:hypothetical protein
MPYVGMIAEYSIEAAVAVVDSKAVVVDKVDMVVVVELVAGIAVAPAAVADTALAATVVALVAGVALAAVAVAVAVTAAPFEEYPSLVPDFPSMSLHKVIIMNSCATII